MISDLKSELSGRLEQVVLGLMDPVPVFQARCLRKAMKVRKVCCVVSVELLRNAVYRLDPHWGGWC